MALAKGTKRYKHNITGEIRYFRNSPNQELWTKIGTPGSKNWRWITNGVFEKYIGPEESLPTGYSLGRIKN